MNMKFCTQRHIQTTMYTDNKGKCVSVHNSQAIGMLRVCTVSWTTFSYTKNIRKNQNEYKNSI